MKRRVCTDLLAVLLGLLGVLGIGFGVFALPCAWFVFVVWMRVPLADMLEIFAPLAIVSLPAGTWLFIAADRRCKRLEDIARNRGVYLDG